MFKIRENDIGFKIRKLSNLIKRDVEKSRVKLEIEDIKGINGWAIAYLYENRDKDIFQKDFETHFSIRRSTASVILKTMEQKGFILRQSTKSDARLKKIVLTEKAIDIHRKITSEIEEREKKLRLNVSEEELNIFFKCIDMFCNNMEEKDD